MSTATKPKSKPNTEVLPIRAQPAWHAWLDATAKKAERTKASLIAAGMIEYAKANGIEPPPSRT